MIRHVVMWGGGTTSWATARIVIDEHGPNNVVLLFADTLAEDADLHRFTAQCSEQLGVPVTRVCDGRTPEQVDVDRKWLSNSQVAQCSYWLKIVPCRTWLEDNTSPNDAIVYVGLDWTEPERLPAVERGWAPWPVQAPLMTRYGRSKPDWTRELEQLGIPAPRLYRQGFAHNNCGGACVRGGQAQWAHLARVNPALFDQKMQHEQRMQALLGKPHTYLRDRTGGVTTPLPLTVIRQRVESQPTLLDVDDWGGCGCFTDDALPSP